MLALKRVYDKASPEDGVRFLVERLWPRGIKKTDLRLDAWLKDVAPSAALRLWFAHDLKKWTKPQQRYFAELDSQPEACEQIRSAARHGRVTLVYSSHDTEPNNAVALKEYLECPNSRRRSGCPVLWSHLQRLYCAHCRWFHEPFDESPG